MKARLIIVALVVSSLSFGQVHNDLSLKENIYKKITGLKLADSVSSADIIGGFSKSDGFGGYRFRLDSNMTFQKIDFDCLLRAIADSRSWKILNNNTVVLKSKKEILLFDIVEFDDFYFFILPFQRQKFIKDLKEMKIKFKNIKPFNLENKMRSTDFVAGYWLRKKYYVKEITTPINP